MIESYRILKASAKVRSTEASLYGDFRAAIFARGLVTIIRHSSNITIGFLASLVVATHVEGESGNAKWYRVP